MSTLQYGEALSDHGDLGSFYAGLILATEDQAPREAFYLDSETSDGVLFQGSGFTYDDRGQLLTGTITQIKFQISDDQPLAIIEGNYDAATLFQVYSTKGVDALLSKMLAGNDTIQGTLFGDSLLGLKGNDKISGGFGDDDIQGNKGNDRLTGGAGADTFLFFKGDGKDVITDFDAKGSGHDLIGITADEHYTIEAAGHNTLIDFGHGDTITLLSVNFHDVSSHDFATPA